MQRKRFMTGLVASTAVLLFGVGASVAQAAPAAPAIPTITSLPLFGVQLTVEVATGPGGILSSVSVNPADGLTAAKVKPNKVVFVNEEGTAKVVVSGRDGRQGLQVKAGALADVSGAGGWSGDVFNTGVATTVSFTIGATADGGPDITGVSSSDLTAVIGATEYKNDDDDDGDDGEMERVAAVRITFTSGGQSRSLAIRAEVSTDDDDDGTNAKVSVALGKLRGVVQSVADAIGAKVWTGMLCDGTQATINYTVNADGSISAVTATPAPARLENKGGKVDVRFSDSERVKIRAHMEDDGIRVTVDEKIRCRDAADPTVNTPIDTDHEAGNEDHGDENDSDDDHEDDGDDDHDGGGDDDKDNG